MDARRRQQALSVFGVVQYRERGMASETDQFSQIDAPSEVSVVSADTVSDSIEALRAVTEELATPSNTSKSSTDLERDRDSRMVDEQLKSSSTTPYEATTIDSAPSPDAAETEQVGREFDLHFWRCGNLLALESSRSSEADSDLNSELKHRLVNNVFRAVYGEKGIGATMYNLHWPDQLNKDKTDDKDASEWLLLFFKGQLAKDPNTKLWLMGDDLIELMLSRQGRREELEGTRIFDNNLGMEVFVAPSLSDLASKPYLKATLWKLLKVLSPTPENQ